MRLEGVCRRTCVPPGSGRYMHSRGHNEWLHLIGAIISFDSPAKCLSAAGCALAGVLSITQRSQHARPLLQNTILNYNKSAIAINNIAAAANCGCRSGAQLAVHSSCATNSERIAMNYRMPRSVRSNMSIVHWQHGLERNELATEKCVSPREAHAHKHATAIVTEMPDARSDSKIRRLAFVPGWMASAANRSIW